MESEVKDKYNYSVNDYNRHVFNSLYGCGAVAIPIMGKFSASMLNWCLLYAR